MLSHFKRKKSPKMLYFLPLNLIGYLSNLKIAFHSEQSKHLNFTDILIIKYSILKTYFLVLPLKGYTELLYMLVSLSSVLIFR